MKLTYILSLVCSVALLPLSSARPIAADIVERKSASYDTSISIETDDYDTLFSETVTPTEPLASIVSTAETSRSTVFSSSLPASFTPETGTVITTITQTSLSSLSVSTLYSSLETYIDVEKLTNVKVIVNQATLPSSSSSSSATVDLEARNYAEVVTQISDGQVQGSVSSVTTTTLCTTSDSSEVASTSETSSSSSANEVLTFTSTDSEVAITTTTSSCSTSTVSSPSTHSVVTSTLSSSSSSSPSVVTSTVTPSTTTAATTTTLCSTSESAEVSSSVETTSSENEVSASTSTGSVVTDTSNTSILTYFTTVFHPTSTVILTTTECSDSEACTKYSSTEYGLSSSTSSEESTETSSIQEPVETTATEEPAQTTTTKAPAQTTATEEPAQTTVTEEPAQTTATEEPAQTTATEEPAQTTATEPQNEATSTEAPVYATRSTTSSASTHSTETTTFSTSSSSQSYASGTGSTIDLFEPIATDEPPSVFPREDLLYSIASGVDNGDTPYETNKFYINLMLNGQSNPAFTFPYSFFYDKWSYSGIGITHTTSSVFGDENSNGAASYYSNAILVGSLIFSSTSFSSDNIGIEVTNMKAMSALATLTDGSDSNYIDVPLVEGMGFGSAIYNGDLTPEINSQVGFESLVAETSSALAENVLKYRATLADSVDWLIYVTLPSDVSTSDFELTVSSVTSIVGSSAIDGLIIQVAPAPDDNDSYYDEAAGMYPVSCEVQGSYVEGASNANYQFVFNTEGSSVSGSTIVFALAHQVSSFTDATVNAATGITLYSPSKGTMYAYLTNTLSMSETLNLEVSYLPYSEILSGSLTYTAEQLQLIATVANSELSIDIPSLLKAQDSMYTAGKVLDKYAYILLTVSEIIGDDAVTESTLSTLKTAFSTFINNEEYYPLIYDTKFKGITSSAGQDGDTEADYGSSHYNDHHFHYGYFIHAAAVVGYIDSKYGGSWASDNKDWVNSLIRDVINPSSQDNYFPVSRMYDWFHGHSWAGGLTDAGDGLNQESDSEDYNCYYGMKLWGSVIGDKSMQYRGDLMMSIFKKSINSYYLFQSDNTIEPSQYIGNKVAGILFQNKLDYTTYFGTNTEYIHGIHMLPITPASGLIRASNFVAEEWDSIISNIIDSVDSGWTSILRINQALSDPSSAYDFYSSDSWNDEHLDNGQSRTWGLTFSAGLLNSSS